MNTFGNATYPTRTAAVHACLNTFIGREHVSDVEATTQACMAEWIEPGDEEVQALEIEQSEVRDFMKARAEAQAAI